MRVTVTGSRGFIGSHVKSRLESLGHIVDEWDSKIDKSLEDLDPRSNRLELDTDYVIHLAAFANVRESINHPQKYWDNNVSLTTKLQKYCHNSEIPLLYASSSCVHNWHLSPYGMSKKINEETAFYNQVGLRFTTVYGEGARDSMLIGRLIDGRVDYLTNHIRDFIHVDDVVDAIILLMDKDLNKLKPVYDIGTGKGVVVSELGFLAGCEVEVRAGEECEAWDNTADNSDLKDLGWSPKYDIEEYVMINT